MPLGLLGKKLGMTQIFDTNGNLVPVTLIEAGPCYVLQVKNKQKDGYSAIQIGFDRKPKRKARKPELGHVNKAGTEPMRFVRELYLEEADTDSFSVGQTLTVDLFKEGERVDVTGTSKGRGFAGTVKRFGTSRGPMTHGSTYHRRPGSTGSSSDPSRIFKGKVMPGHMGNKRRTIPNLMVVKTDKERNILMVKGSVPGALNSYIVIKKSNRTKRG